MPGFFSPNCNTTATMRRACSAPLASALTALAVGRLQRYARSGFKRLPTEHLEPALHRLTT